MRRFTAMTLLVAALCLSAISAAADALPALATGLGRPPRIGEWLDYILAYPVDPLENGLAASPLPPVLRGSAESGAYPLPSFDAPEAWRSVPMRLEIRKIEANGVTAALTLAGRTRTVLIPLAGKAGADDDDVSSGRFVQRIGFDVMEVEVFRGEDAGGPFVRCVNRDVPFGLTRFSTRDFDLILTGMGAAQPPEFPQPAPDINPPPGGMKPE